MGIILQSLPILRGTRTWMESLMGLGGAQEPVVKSVQWTANDNAIRAYASPTAETARQIFGSAMHKLNTSNLLACFGHSC